MIKINLASGQRPFKKPWTNIDLIDQGYPVDILTDAKDLNMFADESVDIIVAHHLVEHIAIHELNDYLKEWRRVLKKGGILAVFVPDLRALDKAWLAGEINTYIHNVNTYGAWQGHISDLHKWGYDDAELTERFTTEFQWAEVRGFNGGNAIYEGSNIAQDWWILSKEFVK
jgi:predicted SAM-dependent methyltransferase